MKQRPVRKMLLANRSQARVPPEPLSGVDGGGQITEERYDVA